MKKLNAANLKRLLLHLPPAVLLLAAVCVPVFIALTPEPARAMSGSGTAEDPYIIMDVNDLQDMSLDSTACYALGANINAVETKEWNWDCHGEFDCYYEGFDPIGTFTGSLDGRGYTISNLYINRPAANTIGLFSDTDNATITNVGLVNPDITGQYRVGGIVGYINDAGTTLTSITDSYVSGGTISGQAYTGGMAGYIASTDNASSPVIYCSWTDTDVIALYDENGYGGFGGMIGHISEACIRECYATGNITGDGIADLTARFGGFVGYLYGTIYDCYAMGNVSIDYTVEGGDRRADSGGFCGHHASGFSIYNSYSTGSVTVTDPGDPCYTGGFCSFNLMATISNCFWDMETSGMTESSGATGLSSANMKLESTYETAEWDLESVWCMPSPGCNDGYPILQYNMPGETCVCMAQPPLNLMAVPVSGTSISLSWYNPNTSEDWPDLMAILRSRTGTFPADPPSGSDSTLVYYASAGGTGTHTATHNNLTPGTTYFYRVWFYDPDSGFYTSYSEDFATTFAGIASATTEEPSQWFQEPSCLSYYNTPLWPAMNYAITTYEWPEGYFCMTVSLLLISIVCLLAYGIAAVGTQGSVKSIAVPFILGAGLIGYGGTAMTLFPLGLALVSFFILGGVGVFIWTRA